MDEAIEDEVKEEVEPPWRHSGLLQEVEPPWRHSGLPPWRHSGLLQEVKTEDVEPHGATLVYFRR